MQWIKIFHGKKGEEGVGTSTKCWTTEKKVRRNCFVSSARPFQVLNFVRLKISSRCSNYPKRERDETKVSEYVSFCLFSLFLSRFLSFPRNLFFVFEVVNVTSGQRVETWQKQIDRGDSFSSISPKLVSQEWNPDGDDDQLLVIRRLSKWNWLPSEQFNEDYRGGGGGWYPRDRHEFYFVFPMAGKLDGICLVSNEESSTRHFDHRES